jgi:hypothetical protein
MELSLNLLEVVGEDKSMPGHCVKFPSDDSLTSHLAVTLFIRSCGRGQEHAYGHFMKFLSDDSLINISFSCHFNNWKLWERTRACLVTS